jgi:hypothetical protein
MAEVTKASDGATVIDGVRFVPESDLLAAKKSLEGDLSKVKTEAKTSLDEALAKADKHYNDLLSERNNTEKLNGQVKELSTHKSTLETVQKELDTLKPALETANTRFMDLYKMGLSREYGLDIKALEGKTEGELKTLDEAMKLRRPVRNTFNGDVSGGAGAGTTSNPRQVELDELDEAVKKKTSVLSK